MDDKDESGRPIDRRADIIGAAISILIAFLNSHPKSPSSDDGHKANENAIVRYTKGLWFATLVIAIAACLSFIAAILQWRAISGTLAEMRDEQRPWIRLSEVTGTGKGTDSVHFDIIMENIGKRPTNSFAVDAAVVDGEYAWIEKAKQICSDLNKFIKGNSFSAIPGGRWPLNSEDIPSATAVPNGSTISKMDIPFLSGCAAYTFDGDASIHNTPFGAHLKVDGAHLTSDRIYAANAN